MSFATLRMQCYLSRSCYRSFTSQYKNPLKSQVILGDYHEQGDYYAYNCQTGFATLSCSALMAFQMISTNDIPEVMEGLRLDYHDGNGQWQIIVQLYFLRIVFLK